MVDYKKLVEKIKPMFFEEYRWEHTKRVYNYALEIAKTEDVDIDVVKLSALLHDIKRQKSKEIDWCHAEESAKLSPELLKYPINPGLDNTVRKLLKSIGLFVFMSKIKYRVKHYKSS